jgi:hypothetical protein
MLYEVEIRIRRGQLHELISGSFSWARGPGDLLESITDGKLWAFLHRIARVNRHKYVRAPGCQKLSDD